MKKRTKFTRFTAHTDKMSGGSGILQKKLHELESDLANVIRHPLDPTSYDPRLQIPFQDIKQRFVFLNNLLQREIDSGEPQNPDELHEIGKRLTALQTGFRRSNEWRHSLCSDCSKVLIRAESEGAYPSEIQPENLLIGSKRDDCTQVVPYVDDDVRGPGSDLNSDFSGDEENVRKEAVGAEEERVWGKMGKYSGAFGCGMIVGAIGMAKLFYISFSLDSIIPYEALLLPPT